MPVNEATARVVEPPAGPGLTETEALPVLPEELLLEEVEELELPPELLEDEVLVLLEEAEVVEPVELPGALGPGATPFGVSLGIPPIFPPVELEELLPVL